MNKVDYTTRGRNQLRVRLIKNSGNDESVHDLLKLPIEVLYAEALREIGEQEAYIDELKDSIKRLNIENASLRGNIEQFKRINREQRMSIKRDEMYTQQENKNNKLKARIETLQENVSKLVVRIVKYENELNLLRGQLNQK